MPQAAPHGPCSVWVFTDEPGDHYPLAAGIDAEAACRLAERATVEPGPARRVVVIDGAGDTIFEWQRLPPA